ncbi:MAG: PorT family protein [Bacteroidales bacterium]|nr:PorT family protein [Bacteroidales bacterium]
MKKSLLFVGLLLAMSLTVSAQNNGFAFGFKLGPGFDWTGSTTGAAQNEGLRTGFGVGVVAEYYFAPNYAIVTGVNVSMNRGHYSFDNGRMVMGADSVSVFETYKVDRMYKATVYEIPLMLKMMTNELGNLPLRAYAQVGAGLGYAQRVKVMDDNAGEYAATNKEYSNLRASLKIGAGAQYAIDESTRVFAGLYFSHDFINNINSIAPNHYAHYFEDNNKIGDRDPKLNVLQNRLGIEVGILF